MVRPENDWSLRGESEGGTQVEDSVFFVYPEIKFGSKIGFRTDSIHSYKFSVLSVEIGKS